MCDESDESKFLNDARDFHKNNPNASVYDYINQSNYYKYLSDYDKKHYTKKLSKIFDEDSDSVHLYVETKDN